MCALTSTPRLSRGLVTSLLAHGIWLTLVLRNTSVDGLDDIRSNGRSEDLYNCYQLAFLIPFPSSRIILPPIANSSTRILSFSYLWERVSRTAGRAIGGQDGDSRTGSHLEGLMTLSWVSSWSLSFESRCRETSKIIWWVDFQTSKFVCVISEPIINGGSKLSVSPAHIHSIAHSFSPAALLAIQDPKISNILIDPKSCSRSVTIHI